MEAVMSEDKRRNHHVCPVWVGYLLLSPIRRLLESPSRILGPHVRPGMTIVEPGCAMGFFTLPLARMTGPMGMVLAVDMEKRMIDRLKKRARRAGLSGRIEASVCDRADLGLEAWKGKVHFIPAIHVVHEVADRLSFMKQAHSLLRSGGRFLMIEPRSHVKNDDFSLQIEMAKMAGFSLLPLPREGRSRSALFEKQ